MLQLDTKLTLSESAIKSPNLADRFSEEDLKRIGSWCWEGYTRDRGSRQRWERRTEAAMDLALQVQKDKTFPWPGCSNVAFPLVTIAAMQFHSRAYPAIINGNDIVRCRVIGDDPKGEKTARATRISTHMSWQVMEQDAAWEEQQDRLLIQLPIVGCAFKKSYYADSVGHNASCLVSAKDLVIDYWARSVEECPRKTQITPLFRNEVYERAMRETFCKEIIDEAWFKQPPSVTRNTQQLQRDNRQGVTVPQGDETTPFNFLEQHVNVDLDQDGYAEPYIITFEEQSKCVARIVTRFDREADIEKTRAGKVIQIRALEYFTKYSFIPSPDGGIYDIGFGILLGPLNESTNSIVNQLIDSGTMATTAGGFLGRGAKIRGGVYTFSPFQWNRVDSTGEDLGKSIFPLPVKEPSAVLFQLLGFLVNYTNRISGSTDMMVGENPGQNTPAQTSQEMVAQGSKIYSAIFKRVWRSTKAEFKKLFVLNGIFLPVGKSAFGNGQLALREDYLGNPDEVVPAADPNVTSDREQLQQAGALKQAAATTRGYNPDAVERRFLKALKIDAIDEIFPGAEKMPPSEDIKITLKKMDMELEGKKLQFEQMQFVAEMQEEQKLNNAKILDLQANAMKAVADIEGDQKDREINAINTAIGVAKHRNEVLSKRIETILKAMELSHAQRVDRAGVPGMVAAPGDQALERALGAGEESELAGAVV